MGTEVFHGHFRFAKKHVISGGMNGACRSPLSARSPSTSAKCVVHNVLYVKGVTISSHDHIASYEDCLQRCRNIHHCAYFAWNGATAVLRCTLFANGDYTADQGVSGAVSGTTLGTCSSA
jgi:hypothetical protein